MAKFRTIRRGFWQSPSIEQLSPAEKLLYIYLFTNPASDSSLGVTRVSLNLMALQTGLDVGEVKAALASLERVGKVIRDGASGAVLVKNFIKHQTTTSPKVKQMLKADISRLDIPAFQQELVALYPEYFDTLSIPYQNPINRVSIPPHEKEKEKEREKEREFEFEHEDIAGHVCQQTPPARNSPNQKPKAMKGETSEAFQQRYMAWAKAEVDRLLDEKGQQWAVTYPALDIGQECRKALAWLDANPAKRKNNLAGFLNNWLSRGQDSPRGQSFNKRGNGPAEAAQPKTYPDKPMSLSEV